MMNVLLNLAHSDNYGLMYYDTSDPNIVVYHLNNNSLNFFFCILWHRSCDFYYTYHVL